MQSASGTARSELKTSASTAIQQRQMHREAKEKRRAVQRAQTQRAQLKAKGREGLLPHGKQLLAAVAQPAADALTELLAGYVEAPPVGRHYAAIPILERFGNPMEAVAIALRCLMDRITSTRTFLALAGEIGASLEHEYRAQQMVEKDRLTFLQMRKLRQRSKCRGRLLGKAGMRALNLHLEPWGERDRLQVGSLMLELVALNTGLVEIVKVQREGAPDTGGAAPAGGDRPGSTGQGHRPGPDQDAHAGAAPPMGGVEWRRPPGEHPAAGASSRAPAP